MGGIGFKFVMFRFYGSEKLTLRKLLSWHKKGMYRPGPSCGDNGSGLRDI
jgi:hypothetical protein